MYGQLETQLQAFQMTYDIHPLIDTKNWSTPKQGSHIIIKA